MATRVEMKAAARMRNEGIGQATVVINHVSCLLDSGCKSLIGVVLPEGSSLTVHGAGGHQRTFTGGKQPPWRR
ncbi:SCP1.201-like deaminase [Saccharothrix sp. BKS2]|uniref:DddA-like double-stranded DNA deaminase toxin n=1 Tax=Saccharothrix sp. BKS2 TaxID=3064400 RepID=UPI0039E9159A